MPIKGRGRKQNNNNKWTIPTEDVDQLQYYDTKPQLYLINTEPSTNHGASNKSQHTDTHTYTWPHDCI
mgnify:CR=1 FL=1